MKTVASIALVYVALTFFMYGLGLFAATMGWVGEEQHGNSVSAPTYFTECRAVRTLDAWWWVPMPRIVVVDKADDPASCGTP